MTVLPFNSRQRNEQTASSAICADDILPAGDLFARLRVVPEDGAAFWLCGQRSGHRAGGTNSQGYCVINFRNHHYRLHHLIWRFVHGYWPSEIDHIDGDRLNNRIDNLRECTHAENLRNKGIQPTNKSGVVGVCFDIQKKKWLAYISAHGRSRKLGQFKNFDDAVAARKAAERQYGYHPNHGKREATCGL